MVLRHALLTGGSGLLGGYLQDLQGAYEVVFTAPSSSELNVNSRIECAHQVSVFSGDTVVHCAAIAKPAMVQEDPSKAIRTNVCGTINMLEACRDAGKRFVYISTDHVFNGVGPHKHNGPMNPLTHYAKTKAAADLLVQTYANSLIIRTSFWGKEFPYEAAFTDQFTTKGYIDEIAQQILCLIYGGETGVAHVGTPRLKTIQKAAQRKHDVKGITLKESKALAPVDASLVLGHWGHNA